LAARTSLFAVVAALVGNTAVTLLKFVAFALSGSGAMLSEAIHSSADTANQLLLLLGLKRSERQRDRRFQYGYGGERFVFGILSAAGIFFVGCGVTVYHGITALFARHEPQIGAAVFAVLGVSLLIEGSVFVLALRSIWSSKGSLPYRQYLRERADPATLAVLLEDGAAVLGLMLAAMGIVAYWITGNPVFDAMASMLIGLLLGVIAIYLIQTNRGLLLGRAVPPDSERLFVQRVLARGSVADVHDVKTRQLSTEDFQFKAEVRFSEPFVARVLERALAGRKESTDPATLAAAARMLIQALSEEIDVIEADVRAAIPEARHIDLELEHLPAAAAAAR
jgi:zinc transporter 9